MKKYGYPILLAILIGFLLGNFMIKRYDLYDGITFASNSTEKIYFFQYGVYSSIESMEKNIADALEIEKNCVNVKATTEERLGFTGAGLGIAAQAVCMIEKSIDGKSNF